MLNVCVYNIITSPTCFPFDLSFWFIYVSYVVVHTNVVILAVLGTSLGLLQIQW